MVKLNDVWEELPDTSIYVCACVYIHIHTHCQKQNVSNLYHFDMALRPDR
jgi:hypothetical protein